MSKNKIVPVWYGRFRVKTTFIQVIMTVLLYIVVRLFRFKDFYRLTNSVNKRNKNILYPVLKQTVSYKDAKDLEDDDYDLLADETKIFNDSDLEDELILPTIEIAQPNLFAKK